MNGAIEEVVGAMANKNMVRSVAFNHAHRWQTGWQHGEPGRALIQTRVNRTAKEEMSAIYGKRLAAGRQRIFVSRRWSRRLGALTALRGN